MRRYCSEAHPIIHTFFIAIRRVNMSNNVTITIKVNIKKRERDAKIMNHVVRLINVCALMMNVDALMMDSLAIMINV